MTTSPTSLPSPPPFTVVKGQLDNAETEALGHALGVLLAEAAEAAARTSTDPREVSRLRARTTARGHWGTPATQFSTPSSFNPTGFRG